MIGGRTTIFLETAKEKKLYRTDLLDQFKGGMLEELQKTVINDEVRTLYKVHRESESFIFRSVVCPLDDAKAIDQVRNEYQISLRCSKLTDAVAKPLKYKELVDEGGKQMVVETLYECFGETMHSLLRKLSAKVLLDVMMRSLEPLAILQENGVFLSSLTPSNILVKDGIAKILALGNSGEFEKRTEMVKSGKIPNKDLIYYPPEVLNSEKTTPSKVDAYMWGMSFYQLLAEKRDADLEADLKTRRADYEQFVTGIKKLSLREDKDGSLMREFLRVLLMVLDENPEKRYDFKALVEKLLDKEYYKLECKKLTGMYAKLSKEHADLSVCCFCEA